MTEAQNNQPAVENTAQRAAKPQQQYPLYVRVLSWAVLLIILGAVAVRCGGSESKQEKAIDKMARLQLAALVLGMLTDSDTTTDAFSTVLGYPADQRRMAAESLVLAWFQIGGTETLTPAQMNVDLDADWEQDEVIVARVKARMSRLLLENAVDWERKRMGQ